MTAKNQGNERTSTRTEQQSRRAPAEAAQPEAMEQFGLSEPLDRAATLRSNLATPIDAEKAVRKARTELERRT